MKEPILVISPEQLDAVIFDMDGVVTQTANVHAAAWKKMFDTYPAARTARSGESYALFSVQHDYTRYVDGKPRYDGVRDFLEARGIRLPEGSSADAADEETVRGLGNSKNAYFQQELDKQGVAMCCGSTPACPASLAASACVFAIVASASRWRSPPPGCRSPVCSVGSSRLGSTSAAKRR